MVKSARSLAADPGRVHVYLGLDRDDPEFNRYLADSELTGVTVLVNEEKRSCPALLEWLAGECSGDIILIGSDDILFRTPKWDQLTEAEFAAAPDGVLAVAFNDFTPNRGTKWTHFAISREWFRRIGHLGPTSLEHFGTDEYVERLATASGRGKWLGHVVVEHMHAKYGKAPNDDQYRAKRQKAGDGSSMSSRDVARLQALLPRVAELAERLKARSGAPAARAA